MQQIQHPQKSNHRDGALDEVEKNSFVALPGKWGHSGLMTSKLCVPIQGDLVRSLIPILMAQTVKNLPAMWEAWVQSLGWEDPLEEGMATHSSILA